jgi:hypothetical protein
MSQWTFSPAAAAFSLVEFLRSQTDLHNVRSRNKTMTRYLVSNCSSLLEYALSDSDTDLGGKAFVLLSKASRAVVQGLLDADLFFVKATEVLMGRTVSSLLVSRLATMLSTIIAKQRSCYAESIGFLCQMLPFIADPSVFSLVCSVCGPSPKAADLQAVLARTSFPVLILREFDGESVSSEKLANLCAVVGTCLKNERLQAGFATDAVVARLSQLLQHPDLFVQNHLWEALANLCTTRTCAGMSDVREAALAMLQPSVTDLHIYQVCALDFLAKCMQFGPAMFSEMEGFAVLNTILRLMLQFPDATNLVAAEFRCLRAGLRAPQMRMDIVHVFVPILIGSAEARERTAIAAHSRMFLADLEASRGGNADVDRALREMAAFCEFREQRLLRYMAVLKDAYGGPITKYVKKVRPFDELIRQAAKNPALLAAVD